MRAWCSAAQNGFGNSDGTEVSRNTPFGVNTTRLVEENSEWSVWDFRCDLYVQHSDGYHSMWGIEESGNGLFQDRVSLGPWNPRTPFLYIAMERLCDQKGDELCGGWGNIGYRVGEKEKSRPGGDRAHGGISPSSESPGRKRASSMYRTGGYTPISIPPVRSHGISDNPGMLQRAIARYWDFREHQPFTRRETLPEAADST